MKRTLIVFALVIGMAVSVAAVGVPGAGAACTTMTIGTPQTNGVGAVRSDGSINGCLTSDVVNVTLDLQGYHWQDGIWYTIDSFGSGNLTGHNGYNFFGPWETCDPIFSKYRTYMSAVIDGVVNSGYSPTTTC